jgi:hypothetical protein
MARELTEKQAKFLEVLFEQAGGDVVRAKELAGYSDNSPTSEIIKCLKDEIMERTQLYMARNAPRAAMSLVSGMIDLGAGGHGQDDVTKITNVLTLQLDWRLPGFEFQRVQDPEAVESKTKLATGGIRIG